MASGKPDASLVIFCFILLTIGVGGAGLFSPSSLQFPFILIATVAFGGLLFCYASTVLGTLYRLAASRKTSARIAWITLLAVCGGLAVAGIALFTRDSPRTVAVLVAVLMLLCFLAYLSNLRQARHMRFSESFLATLHCPGCGANYGSEAAHRAFNPPPLPPDVRDDDFGFARVVCPACLEAAIYGRSSHVLQSNRDPAIRTEAENLPKRDAADIRAFLEKTFCSRCGTVYGPEVECHPLPFPDTFIVCPICDGRARYHTDCCVLQSIFRA